MKILWITNISAKITHFSWHYSPLTHILKWFLYKGRGSIRQAQVQPILISQHKGVRRRFGKSWSFARVNKARFGDEGCLCPTYPNSVTATGQPGPGPQRRKGARKDPGPPPGMQSPALSSVFLKSLQQGNETSRAKPTEEKSCDRAVRAQRKWGWGHSPDPRARRPSTSILLSSSQNSSNSTPSFLLLESITSGAQISFRFSNNSLRKGKEEGGRDSFFSKFLKLHLLYFVNK